MSLKKNVIANYLGQGWVALMGLAFIPVYIKYLGIEAYGLIGIFALLQAWLGLFEMSTTPTLSREMARFNGGDHSNESIRDLLRSIEMIAFGIAMFTTLAIWLSSEWLANNWLKAENIPISSISQAFTIMGAVTALRFLESIYRSSLIGLQNQVLLNIINSVMATVRGFGAIGVLIWISSTIEAFFLWQGLVSITSVIFLAIATYSHLPKGGRAGIFSMTALKKIWQFASGMLGITLLSLLLTQIDKLLLSKILPLSEFGYYILAGVVAGTIYILITPITQAFYPKLCELYSSGNITTLTDNYHKGAQLVSVIAGSIAIVMMLFSESLLILWTNDANLAQQVSPLLSILMFGNLLNGLMLMPYQIQIAYGWISLTVRINIATIFIIVPAILWVTPHYGAEGAAWVWVSLNVFYIIIGIHLMFRQVLLNEKWRWYYQDVMLPLAAAIAAAGLVKLISPQPENAISQIITIIIALLAALSTSGLITKHVRTQLLSLTANQAIFSKFNPKQR